MIVRNNLYINAVQLGIVILITSLSCSNEPRTYWKTTRYSNGNLKDSFIVLDSNGNEYKNGYYFSYDSLGKILKWHKYQLDVLHGKQITFYNNGSISSFYFYKKGIQVKNSYKMYRNGCIHQLDTFVDGRKYGGTTLFDSMGSLIQKGANKTTGFACGSCGCKN